MRMFLAATVAGWVVVATLSCIQAQARQASATAGGTQVMAETLDETDFVAHGYGPEKLDGQPASASAPVIVIGFVGGFVNHENSVHSPVQLGARLRAAYPSGVYVEVFENHRRQEAYRKILELLDVARAGKLSEEEKRQARIVIYGISWGGSETVTLARELEDANIPVLLTIQVDSVEKLGQNDERIPANVAEAANFYQTNGMLHGRPKIRAEDQAHTRILGNFRYDYRAQSLPCEGYPWYDRVLTRYHTEIECDPAVWNRVEGLIRGKLPPAEAANAR